MAYAYRGVVPFWGDPFFSGFVYPNPTPAITCVAPISCPNRSRNGHRRDPDRRRLRSGVNGQFYYSSQCLSRVSFNFSRIQGCSRSPVFGDLFGETAFRQNSQAAGNCQVVGQFLLNPAPYFNGSDFTSRNHHPMLRPFSTSLSTVSRVTSSPSTAPSTRHSLKKLAICLGGKLTTAMTCFPISSSVV